MLEEPDLQVERLISCLQDDYELPILQVAFLPLGADRSTAVYRVVSEDGTPYFIKLRRGAFDETTVTLPKFLSEHSIVQIIAPLTTKTGHLWATLKPYKLILYPFVEGHNGYEVVLADHHWVELGTVLKSLHTMEVPPAIGRRIPLETYSADWREIVRTFLARVDYAAPTNPVAEELTAFLKAKRDEILDLVGRAERLAWVLQSRSPDFVLCHSDVHAGNILIDPNGAIYIVDWDNPIFAPKERDLMFVGGGLGGDGHTAQEEETLFYRGYGQAQIDQVGLTYYRYERIVQDIAVFCQRIYSTYEGRKDREQSLRYLKSNFLPNSTIEIAYRSDIAAGGG
jgi:spectinomycin phosphotransferase